MAMHGNTHSMHAYSKELWGPHPHHLMHDGTFPLSSPYLGLGWQQAREGVPRAVARLEMDQAGGVAGARGRGGGAQGRARTPIAATPIWYTATVLSSSGALRDAWP